MACAEYYINYGEWSVNIPGVINGKNKMKIKTETVEEIILSFKQNRLSSLQSSVNDTPELTKLGNLISELTQNELAEFIAIMLIGRDMGDSQSFAERKLEAQTLSCHPEEILEYLLRQNNLVQYLELGLKRLVQREQPVTKMYFDRD